ncbi:MAG: DUF4856 domain-containing protein [Aureispira sp.]
MKSSILLTLGTAAVLFTACDTKTDDITYDVPETYNFDNVSYSGQENRLDKMAEITSYIKTAHVANASALDATKLKDMYGDNTGGHFSTTDLNASTKQLKSKTITTAQTRFDSYLDAVAVTSQSTAATAANGTAGIATNNAGDKSYLLNANGMEWAQIIEKELMGACFYYQATAVYMGAGKMDVDNETVTAGEGTTMEHHWDEAFGYFGVPKDFPTNTTGLVFWGKYVNKHEGVYPLNKKMMDAFLKGRAAISAKDMTTRDEQIEVLRKEWELVVAATSIYYLNIVKTNLTSDPAAAYHGLSEVYGFISSLQYGAGTGRITTANVETILTDLFGSSDAMLANNYNVTDAKIEAAKTSLVTYFTALSDVKDQL